MNKKHFQLWTTVLHRIGIGVACVLAGALMRKYVFFELEGRIVWVTFYPMVVVAAMFGGWMSGLVAALGAAAFAIWGWSFFIETPFIDDGGDWLGLSAFLVNCGLISVVAESSRIARRKAEAARRQAEEANRAKSIFFANMSHEIRTPLNAILGFARLLEKDGHPGKNFRESVDVIIQSGTHLLGIINNVLDMSRIEAGKQQRYDEWFDVPNFFSELAAMFKYKATTRGLELTLKLDETLPPSMRTDLGKLRQILINLIGNALNFTDEGSISIWVTQTPEQMLKVEVRDTGIGIAPSELSSIFLPFERSLEADKYRAGTGLGLALSKEYAEILGGRITVQSVHHKGSCFTLELPVGPKPQPKNPAANQFLKLSSQTPALALITDDVPNNRTLLRELLSSVGFETIEAQNGLEAVEMVKSRMPIVILMDLLMPKMDGVEATAAIRKQHPNSDVTILGISASAFEKDWQRMISAGANDFLSKPFTPDKLFEKIEAHSGLQFVKTDNSLPLLPRPSSLSLHHIPVDLQQRYQQALQSGEMEALIDLCGEIRNIDQPLADWICQQAQNFDVQNLKQIAVSTEEVVSP